jgi:hypothetical protein
MSEAIPLSGRHQHEARGDTREEPDTAASVGTVVRRDENVRLGVLAGGEKRRFSGRLEIARQEHGGVVLGSSAKDEAPIVGGTAAILHARVQHPKLQAGAEHPVAPLEPAYRDAAVDRVRDDETGHRVALGPRADPEFADVQVAQECQGSAGVIVVIVRESQDLEPAASRLRERRDHDAVAGVEAPASGRARIRQDEPSIGAA